MRSIEDSRKLLQMADVFFDTKELAQTLSMNDTWFWASAHGQYVADDQLPDVARLFCEYGHAGLLYWVSEQNQQMKSEFHDVNRKIQFVRMEELLLKVEPSSTKRAYKKIKYTIGAKSLLARLMEKIAVHG